jgi:hypothetical protein
LRFVDRSSEPCPASLDGPACVGAREIARFKAHLARAAQPAPAALAAGPQQPVKKKPAFRAYKSDDVTQALERLFHKKCAYCESSYRAVVSIQVEHFRPKNRVDGEASHPGYWWLAATWENLLPSCVHCNGVEYFAIHSVTGEPAYTQLAKGSLFKLGKYDFFPIGGIRAFKDSDSLDGEDARLVNPTRMDPSKHLVWIIEGGLSLIAPIHTPGAGWDPHGSETYRTFGLNRQGLVEERTALLRRMMKDIVLAEAWLRKAAATEAGQFRTYLIGQALDLLDALKPLTDADQPYSMMAKSVLETERARITKLFEALLK